MEATSLIISILNLIVLIVSVWLIWKTLKSSLDWNKRKTSQEILDKLIIGEIPDLSTKIRIDYGCKIYDENTPYTKFMITLIDTKAKDSFDATLTRMLNIFEVISIDMKSEIVEEDICYNYLGWFLTAYYKFSKDFIETKRKEAGDPRVLLNFTEYAEKWTQRMKLELKEILDKKKLLI
jgi:hypothetical protein